MSDAKDVRISREAYAPHPLANIVNDLWGHAAGKCSGLLHHPSRPRSELPSL